MDPPRESFISGQRAEQGLPATTSNVASNHSTDSGYSSLSGTPKSPSSGNQVESVTADIKSIKPAASTSTFSLGLFKRKEKIAPILGEEIDEPTREKFNAIKPRFERLLLEHVRTWQRPGTEHQPMSTRPMMMGTSKEDASPHIVIFCQPEQKSLIRRFVKQDIVQALFETGNIGERPFRVVVVGNAPRLRFTVQVLADTPGRALHRSSPTLCGRPISFLHSSGQTRNCTFGGIIKVLTRAGDVQLYGITAGHALHDLGTDIKPNEEDYKTGLNDGNIASDLEGDESDVELDLSPCWTSLPMKDEASGVQSWNFDAPVVIGTILNPANAQRHGTGAGSAKKYYDWALFETVEYEMNEIQLDRKAMITVTKREPGYTGTRPVYILSGSTDCKVGELRAEPGSILLGPGQEFVETYLVAVKRENVIYDGDSGSWVVDRDTFELYGYLVATDSLGDGYIIPITQVFMDIAERLEAKAVGLPGMVDIFLAKGYGLASGTKAVISWQNGMAEKAVPRVNTEQSSLHRIAKSRQPRLRSSCDGCFLAKVKCSKARPICSRCLACGMDCHYSSRSAPKLHGRAEPKGYEVTPVLDGQDSSPTYQAARMSSGIAPGNLITGSHTPPGFFSTHTGPTPANSPGFGSLAPEERYIFTNAADPLRMTTMPWTPPESTSPVPLPTLQYRTIANTRRGWGPDQTQIATPESMSSEYLREPPAAPSLMTRSAGGGVAAACTCFTRCLQSLQELHSASSPVSPPFDLILSLNRKAVESCAALLACTTCGNRSGVHTAAMLLSTLIGKVVSFYKDASQRCFESTDTHVTQLGPVPITFGAYHVNSEDGKWLELEILAREIRKLEEIYKVFRDSCTGMIADPDLSRAVIGHIDVDLQDVLAAVRSKTSGPSYC